MLRLMRLLASNTNYTIDELRLGIRAKNLLLEEYPLSARDLTRKGAYWILETGVYDYAGVCRFYCGLAEDNEGKVMERHTVLKLLK